MPSARTQREIDALVAEVTEDEMQASLPTATIEQIVHRVMRQLGT